MNGFKLETPYSKCLLVSQSIPLKIITIGEKRKLLQYISLKMGKISTSTLSFKRKTYNFMVALNALNTICQ